MNKQKAHELSKAARAMANKINKIKASKETPRDLQQFKAGDFTTVNPNSSSMLLHVLKQAEPPAAANSEADSFNQDYNPRDEQTQSQLAGRLRYYDEDPERALHKEIDKEKVEQQMQQVRSEMIGKFK